MKSNFKKEISVISEDILEIKIDLEKSAIKGSELYWHLAEHLLTNHNDIEVVASEEMVSVRSKLIPIDANRIENSISSFDLKSIIQTDAVLEIPVCYEPISTSDIEEVSKQLKLSVDEIIAIHSSAVYEVKAIGFTPGFSYLGDLDERISVPRLVKPRIDTPVGAVGIANNRTGIYSLGGPGGWPIIGITPINFFNLNNNDSLKLKPGLKINFKEIGKDAFRSIQKEK